MIQKKICIVGASATGKTSLLARFVKSISSDVYRSTVGVKIDRKLVNIGEHELNLVLWDIHGEDEFQKIQMSYVRGSSGYLLVVDRTRRKTLDQAFFLQQRVEKTIGQVPFILILNKSELIDKWEIDDATIDKLSPKSWTVIKGSAKTGLGVEQAFLTLAERMLEE